MFGTISHAKVKPGTEAGRKAFEDEFMKAIRPKVSGPVVFLRGTPKEKPDTEVAVFLCQDEATYYQLADDPEMDALFRKSMENYESEPSWEDVRIDVFVQD